MKKTGSIRWFAFLVFLFMFMPLQVQLVEAKPNYKKIYGKILEKSTVSYVENGHTYTYDSFDHFVLLDINRDGKKELIAETGGYRTCFIYTIKKGKAKLYDVVICFFTNDANDSKYRHFVEYNKKYKGLILHQHGGTGLAGLDIFQMRSNKLKLLCSIESSSLGDNGKVSTTYTKGYWKYYKKYFRSAKKYYMCDNTSTNRKRYLK